MFARMSAEHDMLTVLEDDDQHKGTVGVHLSAGWETNCDRSCDEVFGAFDQYRRFVDSSCSLKALIRHQIELKTPNHPLVNINVTTKTAYADYKCCK